MQQVFLLSGATSGIGREMCLQLAKAGHKVFAFGRRADRLKEIESDCESLAGEVATGVCDVTKRKDLEEVTQAAIARFGRIDVVIANAGFGVSGKFEDLEVSDYKRQFDTNVYGVIENIQVALDEIVKNRGQIVLVGSVNSYFAEPRKTPYCMSKFAIRALAEGLYWEMKPKGVAVTLINPGLVDSEIRQQDHLGVYKEDRDDPAPKRLIMPTDKAVKQIVSAILKRKKEAVITGHGKIIVAASRIAPSVLKPLVSSGRSLSRPKA